MPFELAPRITVDKNICFGKAVVAGTRVPVAIVLNALAHSTRAEVADNYGIEEADVIAALAYAH